MVFNAEYYKQKIESIEADLMQLRKQAEEATGQTLEEITAKIQSYEQHKERYLSNLKNLLDRF